MYEAIVSFIFDFDFETLKDIDISFDRISAEIPTFF